MSEEATDRAARNYLTAKKRILNLETELKEQKQLAEEAAKELEHLNFTEGVYLIGGETIKLFKHHLADDNLIIQPIIVRTLDE